MQPALSGNRSISVAITEFFNRCCVFVFLYIFNIQRKSLFRFRRKQHWLFPLCTCLITYRAKLLNADWFRQRAFFLNFPSMEGKITRSWLGERQNLLAPDWLRAPFLHLVGFLKSFVQNFPTQRSLKILTFKPTYSVEMHGNQAIAGRQCKNGEPKASHTDSKRLFVLKGKTLEPQGTFVCLKKFACCSQVPWPLSLRYGFLQARRAASYRKQHRVSSKGSLIYFLMD